GARSLAPGRSRSSDGRSSPGASAQRRRFFYQLLGRLEDLHLHRLPAQRPLELPDPLVCLPELAGRDDVFVRGDRGRRPRLVVSLPIPNHRGPDVELTAELGQRLLARQNALNLGALELRAEDTPPVGLPRMIAHGASRLMLRPLGVPANWGALHLPETPSPAGRETRYRQSAPRPLARRGFRVLAH